ncbi:MAG TPA: hypothetical protein VNO52_06755, partial [Methylomirabilota bacterium]|nr:hypothetical protein [Methylomirabilota bacterium]
DASLTASNGIVHVGRFELVSPAFTAATAGSLSLADAPMASRIEKWPMTFALRRGLAEKIQLVPKDTPTNAAYARLPDFIRVTGTLAEPKPELTRDLKSLAGSALQLLGDKIPGLDKKTGELLKNVGGLLSGASTNQSRTNAAGTNPPPRFNPLDLLRRPQ